jgi:hypothetical protein
MVGGSHGRAETVMGEHPHVELVRRGYEVLSRGDMDAMSPIDDRVTAINVYDEDLEPATRSGPRARAGRPHRRERRCPTRWN